MSLESGGKSLVFDSSRRVFSLPDSYLCQSMIRLQFLQMLFFTSLKNFHLILTYFLEWWHTACVVQLFQYFPIELLEETIMSLHSPQHASLLAAFRWIISAIMFHGQGINLKSSQTKCGRSKNPKSKATLVVLDENDDDILWTCHS